VADASEREVRDTLQIAKKTVNAVSRGVSFFARQDRDWKVTVVRTNSNMFFYRMVIPYMSIYTMALGATGTQLGIINSIGMAVGGITGLLSGWLIDRTGVKRIYLAGMVVVAVSFLVYGLAQSWSIIIVAMVAYWLGNNASIQGCVVICANCLKSHERATGMSICETFGMGLLGLAAPMVGAWLVTAFGGINVEGIRPLFFICLGGTAAAFLLILTQLSNRSWRRQGEAGLGFFKDFSQIFKQGRNLKRWLIIASVTGLPMGVVTPYIQPFANEFKGADQFVLGAMVTASSLMPLALGIVVGRLADKIGRKKVIYGTIPLVWASYLLLIFAPSPVFLILSGAFQGFFMLAGLTTEAMSRELVPPEHMGRWSGILGLCRMLFAALSVYGAGLLWDHVGPQYVFWAIMAFDLIRIPLLMGMPETLGLRLGAEQTEKEAVV
jgi:DHA1 family multidrug resistance protein-like MFS transporter